MDIVPLSRREETWLAYSGAGRKKGGEGTEGTDRYLGE